MKRILLFTILAVVGSAGWWTCVKLPPDPGNGKPPEVKNLILPTDGATVYKKRDTTFKWRAASGAKSYMWGISTNINFQSLLVSRSTNDTSIVLSSTEPAIAPKTDFYYWSVSGINADGSQGPWAAPNRIKIIRPEISVDEQTPIDFQRVYVKNFDDIIITECRRATITIRNSGIGDLQILTFRFGIAAYAVVKADSFFNLTQGAPSQVIVRFQPRSSGATPQDRNDILKITYSVLGGEDEFSEISFIGKSQNFPEESNNPVYNFGSVLPGNSSMQEFCIANKLNNSVTLSLSFDGDNKDDFSVSPNTLVLAPNGNLDATKAVIVTFNLPSDASDPREAFLNLGSKGRIKYRGNIEQ